MDDARPIETDLPMLFEAEDGFEAPILVKTLTEAAAAFAADPELASVDSFGDRVPEWRATRGGQDYRLMVKADVLIVRRDHGTRWSAVHVHRDPVLADGTPTTDRNAFDPSPEGLLTAAALIGRVARACWRQWYLGMTPDLDAIEALVDRIEADSLQHAAHVEARTGTHVTILDYALASPLAGGRAVARPDDAQGVFGIDAVGPRDVVLPEAVVAPDGPPSQPFLYVVRRDSTFAGVKGARHWDIGRMPLRFERDLDAVGTMRALASTPPRVARQMEGLGAT